MARGKKNDTYLEIQGNELVVEIDGDDASPDKIQTRAALLLALDVLDLVEKIATEEVKQPLSFTGIRLIPKCTQLRLGVSDPAVAEISARKAMMHMHSRTGSTAVKQIVSRLHSDIKTFAGYNQTVSLGVGKALPVAPLRLVEPMPQDIIEIEQDEDIVVPRYGNYWEATTIRAQLLGVLGENPKASFKQTVGNKTNTFQIKVHPSDPEAGRKIAMDLIGSLYKDVEIYFNAYRDKDGKIYDGVLLSFKEVKPRLTSEEFFKRMKELGRDTVWSEVETNSELLKALGRKESEEDNPEENPDAG